MVAEIAQTYAERSGAGTAGQSSASQLEIADGTVPVDNEGNASEPVIELSHVSYSYSLSPREREVIRLRYGLGGTVPLTQREIASTFGISRSYVSRIEKRALEKLRAELEKPVGSGAGQ